MGRGRLRRGCSLEVIFEEDPDFCSHLDSLDGGVAIRFGIKEPDDTISLDSLLEVEEYQVRFQDPADAEQVFRSLDGFIDVRNMDSCMVEWDEFSMDSNPGKIGEEESMENVTTDRSSDPFQENGDSAESGTANSVPVEKPPSGRRSRVSRRQIIQATWMGYSSSSDESVTNIELDENDNVASTRPPRRKSPGNRHHKSKPHKEANTSTPQEKEDDDDGSAEPQSSSGSDSSATTAKSVPIPIPIPVPSPNLVTSVEDFQETEKDRKDCTGGGISLKTPIQIRLGSSPNKYDSSGGGGQVVQSSSSSSLSHFLVPPSPHHIFGRATENIDIMEKDTLDSYISTMTDETDTNAYTFADPFDDTHSVASTNYESSGSASSTESNGSVCTVNSFSMQNGKKTTDDTKTNVPLTSSSSSSKYRTNLKVELVSQLNSSTASASNSNSPSVQPSSSEGKSSSTVKPHQPVYRQQPLLSHLTDQERQAFSGEVKRVRALFELRNHSRQGSERSGSTSNGSTCPSSPESTSRSVSSRNGGDTSPSGSASGKTGLYTKNANGRRSRSSTNGSPSKLLKHSFSNSSPTQQITSADFGDILVNENVVIEDAPDIYQTIRSRRQATLEREAAQSPSSSSHLPSSNATLRRPLGLMNLSPRDPTSLTGSLRRSQSMGTGISTLGSTTTPCSVLRQSSSKSNILAEELPAPDTVKNVRNVFENMLKMKGNNSHGSTSSVDTVSAATPSTGFTGSFSIVKKSLSYIKSNPTSKIYRSESMRDDFPSFGRRYGKPILMSESNSPVHSPNYASSSSPSASTLQIPEESKSTCTAVGEDQVDARPVQRRSSSTSPLNRYPIIERKISEPAKFSPKINTGLSPSTVPSMLRSTTIQSPLTEEEDSSFSSTQGMSSNAVEDYRTRKYVHPDVLQKIRSAGTTTTYFGGKIVAKTIRNRKIPVSRRHTFDLQDYVGINTSPGSESFPNYDSHHNYNPPYYDGGNDGDISGDKFARINSFSSISSMSSSSDIVYGRSGAGGSARPALDIPYKSSSSLYSNSDNRTICGALDSIFSNSRGVEGLLTFASRPIDTTPRIISVLHKSPPGSQTGSPVKSCSPVSSVIEEGRNSPEGCEATNEKTLVEQDGNNNNLPGKCLSDQHHPHPPNTNSNTKENSDGFNKKFSQITEGAWF